MELPSSAIEVVTAGALGHLATINEDGSPHVTCAWVGVEGSQLVIGTLGDQRKLRNMRRDPRVSLSFQTDRTNDWGLREYLIVSGSAEVTEGGAPELLQRLAETYIGPGVKFPAMDDPPQGFTTRITPKKVSGVGPWA
ncbi:MAG: PPOX class F420-dependent oxidoreductase [Actinomycetota bacterium]